MGQFFKIAIGETICRNSASLGYWLVLVCLSMDGFTGWSHWNRASLEKGLKQKHGDMKLKIGLSGAVVFFVEGISSCTKFLLLYITAKWIYMWFWPMEIWESNRFSLFVKALKIVTLILSCNDSFMHLDDVDELDANQTHCVRISATKKETKFQFSKFPAKTDHFPRCWWVVPILLDTYGVCISNPTPAMLCPENKCS